MTYYALSALINFITSTVISILIILRGKKTAVYITFSFFCGTMGFWSAFYFLWQLEIPRNSSLLLPRTYDGGYFHPNIFVSLCRNICGSNEKRAFSPGAWVFNFQVHWLYPNLTRFFIEGLKTSILSLLAHSRLFLSRTSSGVFVFCYSICLAFGKALSCDFWKLLVENK